MTLTSQFCITARVKDPYAGMRTWSRAELEETLNKSLGGLCLEVQDIQVTTPSSYTEEP